MLTVKQGIYEIRNTESGAVYVGQSVDTEKRMQDHRKALVGDRHVNKLLQEEWNEYGEGAFTFEHVETVYRGAFLLPKEKERIDGYVEAGAKLYNVAGVHWGKRWRKLKKTILFNPFRGRQRKPLVLKYLTFRDRPALPEKVVDKLPSPEVAASKLPNQNKRPAENYWVRIRKARKAKEAFAKAQHAKL